jgi:hypothetical protein
MARPPSSRAFHLVPDGAARALKGLCQTVLWGAWVAVQAGGCEPHKVLEELRRAAGALDANGWREKTRAEVLGQPRPCETDGLRALVARGGRR